MRPNLARVAYSLSCVRLGLTALLAVAVLIGWTSSVGRVFAADPEVTFSFDGFDQELVAGQEFEVEITVKVTDNGAIDDATPLRYRATLEQDGEPAEGVTVKYPDAGDDDENDPETWSTFTLDAAGQAYFGPASGFTLQLLPDLVTDPEGVTTPFRTTLSAGSYELTVELMDWTDSNNPVPLGQAGTQAFTVEPPPTPEVTFTFDGFEDLAAETEFEVEITVKVTDNGAIDDATPLRYRATLEQDGEPAEGVTVKYPDVGDVPGDPETWSSFTTDENGEAYFGPASGFRLSDLSDLLKVAGVTTRFRTTLAAGEYSLTVELVDWSVPAAPVRLGEAGSRSFTVAVASSTPSPTPTPPPSDDDDDDDDGGDSGGGGGSTDSREREDEATPRPRSTPTPASTPAVTSTPAPVVTPTPSPEPLGDGVPLPPVEGEAAPLGEPQRSTVPPEGGEVGIGENATLALPGPTTGDAPAIVDVIELAPESVPQTGGGIQVGSRAFQINVTNTQTGERIEEFTEPLTLVYQPTPEELAAAEGDLSRIKVAFWDGSAWVAVTCSADPATNTLTCSIPHLTLFASVIVPVITGPLDLEMPNGRFFKQTNGFNGAGERGFAVIDDEQARFWAEFQRFGGVARLGYPVSGRFWHGGFLTQAFQKLALQWRPELGQAVPVNVFDDLNQRGVDTWLDVQRQVPPAADTSQDIGLSWDEVVARHVALLDPYPSLRDFYLADPDWLQIYGLPLAVKDYGSFLAVRLQRATLQLWKVDVPWAAAGTVVVGNGGDLAKEAGLWPRQATTPGLPGAAE